MSHNEFIESQYVRQITFTVCSLETFQNQYIYKVKDKTNLTSYNAGPFAIYVL